MLTDAILRLKIAFANIPMRGLFFWEGLLFLKDEEYEKIVEGNFTKAISSFPSEEKDAISYYEGVLKDIKTVRKEILDDPAVRKSVEDIREALISEAAHDTVMEGLRENLDKTSSDEKSS